MVAFDVFRQDLTNLLLRCAEHRRRGLSGHPACGEDRRVALLFEKLASSVADLDLQAFLICQTELRHQRLAHTFTQRRDDLLETIGVGFSPADATELMEWMSRRREATAVTGRGAPLKFVALRPATLASAIRSPPSRPADRSNRQPERNIGDEDEPEPFRARHDDPSTIYGSIVSDSAVAFGVVAPMLSVWEVGHAVEAWRDQRVLHAQSPVLARVIASDTVDGGRSTGLAKRVVLTFRPTPQSASCQAAVRLGFGSKQPEPGSAIAVVPRSGQCETPLIPSDVDDPEVAGMIAAGLMLGGLCSIKLWDRMFRKPRHSASRCPGEADRGWESFTTMNRARVTRR